MAVGFCKSFLHLQKYATKAEVAVCSAMTAKICLAVFISLLGILHLCQHLCSYHIFWTIRCTYNPLIFSKMELAPYSLEHLVCGSDCALSPSAEQILCCSKHYQCNSTYLCLFFLGANFFFLSCNQITDSHSFYKYVFCF